jgi:hypothetical protein
MNNEDKNINLYLAHIDKTNESDSGLFKYFYWGILKRVWWKVLLVAFGAPLLYLLIVPIFGDLLSFLLACAIGTLGVLIIYDKVGDL